MRKILYILILTAGFHSNSFSQTRTLGDLWGSKILRYYPNPASVAINFDFQKNYNNRYSLLIFNFMGKKVYELKNISYKTNINLEEFYRGIYIYQLRDKNNFVLESGKFQVLR